MRFEMPVAPDYRGSWETYRLDLSVTPRPLSARARYCDHWEPHRFDRVGELYLTPPGANLHFKSMGPLVHEAITCHLDPDIVHDWLGGPIEWTPARLEGTLDIPGNVLRQLLRRLAMEAHDPGVASAHIVEALMGQLVVELGRHFLAMETGAPHGLSPWRLKLIDERLRELSGPPTLDELSRLCDISVRQLTRGFRISRGCTVGDYIAQIRMDQAKHMIGRGDSPGEIARLLGFASQASFATTFRKSVGVTPRQFQQHLHRTNLRKQNKDEADA